MEAGQRRINPEFLTQIGALNQTPFAAEHRCRMRVMGATVKFKLEIDCNNAAFGEPNTRERNAEVARILTRLAEQLEGSANTRADTIPLRNIKGNPVGRARYTRSRQESW
jgi:hypothetical protein